MLEGRWITLAPLDAEKHAEALYAGSNGDAVRESVWTYLFDGPYSSPDDFRSNIELKARSADPLFFAVIDNATGRRGRLSDADAHRRGQSGHRGWQHHVHAGDAADRRRDRGPISICEIRLR